MHHSAGLAKQKLLKQTVASGGICLALAVLCFAGCSAENRTPPQSPGVVMPSLSPAQAVAALDNLIQRIKALEDKNSVGGLGYELAAGSPNQVSKINLFAEFDLGCGCCSQEVCSEVTDIDIACFGHFETLEVLKIPKAKLQGHGLIAIRDLKNLRELDLSGNPLGDDALEHLAGLTSLESLDLNATEIHGEGLRHLVDLPRLSRLSIRNCRLSPEGWAALGSLTQLKHLGVTAAKIPDDPDDLHVKHLANLRSLESIILGIYYYESGMGGASFPVRMDYEPVEFDRVFRWLGDLPNLKKVSPSGFWMGLTQEGLRHFADPAPLESLGGLRVTILPEEVDAAGGLTAARILDRFDVLTDLNVHVDCSRQTADSHQTVEIGDMDSLETLDLVMPEQGDECHLHNLPSLRGLTVGRSQMAFWRERDSKELSAPCFQRVRFEDLPQLQTVTMPFPRELFVQNVATGRNASDSTPDEASGLRCALYGLLTQEVALPLSSIDALTRLDLLARGTSTPEALAVFRSHPAFSELGLRIDDSPRAWIESISALRDTLRVLELPSRLLAGDDDQSGMPLDTETLAPLARMKNLTKLRLANVIDPDGEPISWVSDLPHLERLELFDHDIGRFHLRLSCSGANWYLGYGRIDTLEISQWPETSSTVNLVDTWSKSIDARKEGRVVCGVDVWGDVNHYVFRDMPHVSLIKLKGEDTETVRLEGDLSQLEEIRDEYRDSRWIIAPTAHVPLLKQETE